MHLDDFGQLEVGLLAHKNKSWNNNHWSYIETTHMKYQFLEAKKVQIFDKK